MVLDQKIETFEAHIILNQILDRGWLHRMELAAIVADRGGNDCLAVMVAVIFDDICPFQVGAQHTDIVRVSISCFKT